MIIKRLGYLIREIRKSKKMSMRELSQRVNVSQVTLWSIEKGTPTVAIGTYLRVISELEAEEKVFNFKKLEN